MGRFPYFSSGFLEFDDALQASRHGTASQLEIAIGSPQGLGSILENKEGHSAGLHAGIRLIGDFEMQILMWEGDEEFPPSAQVLYSDNFAEGFAAEDRVVAGDILITTIKANM